MPEKPVLASGGQEGYTPSCKIFGFSREGSWEGCGLWQEGGFRSGRLLRDLSPRFPQILEKVMYLPEKLMGGQTLEREGPPSSEKPKILREGQRFCKKGYTLLAPGIRFPDPSCPPEKLI
jgi:hypothetical protein